MKFEVVLNVDVDVDKWREEYKLGNAGEALVQVLGDLRSSEYLGDVDLATVTGVEVTVKVFN